MRRRDRALLFLACLAVAPGCGRESGPGSASEDHLLEERVEEYFAERFRFYPVEATAAGFHEHDAELGSFSSDDIRRRLAWLRDFRQKLLGIDLTALSREAYFDALQLSSAVKAEIHELEAVGSWRLAPAFYSDLISRGAWSLIRRDFAPPESRLRSLVSRLRQIPQLLGAARANVGKPPWISVEQGIVELSGTKEFLREIPPLFRTVPEPALLAELETATAEAKRAIEEFIEYLDAALLPIAGQSFAMGEENLRLRLLYQEMEETPLAQLRALGDTKLRETAEAMQQIAARMDGSKPVPFLLGDLAKDYPPPEELLLFTEGLLDDLRRFVKERELVSLPAEGGMEIAETPAFLRMRVLAALDAPGPLEQGSVQAFYSLTIPQADWPPGWIEQQRRLLNSRSLRLNSIRDVYPGSYLHRLFQNRAKTKTRRLLSASSNREGWAHYAEQMLLDQGYGKEDPSLRLLQLHRALVGYCRLVAAIRLHTGELSLAAAAEFFAKEAYLDRSLAEREAFAVALDPGRLTPALGKLRILNLRREYRSAKGASASLREFHDAFLSAGAPPLRLVRLMLLAEEAGGKLDYWESAVPGSSPEDRPQPPRISRK